MSTTTFRRETVIAPAYDKRNPDRSKNYGIHCCELRMVLIGPKCAVQFCAFTGWHLPHVDRELWPREAEWREQHPGTDGLHFGLHGFDVGYHSPTPRYDGQQPMDSECRYVEGGVCYYDGSGLRGEKWGQILVRDGSETIWKMLEAEYKALFETPATPAEVQS